MEKKSYTKEDIVAINMQLSQSLKKEALDKLQRIASHLQDESEFIGVNYIEGMNFVLDDLEEVLLNWEV